MDRLFEGYKRAIDKIWGPIAKSECEQGALVVFHFVGTKTFAFSQKE